MNFLHSLSFKQKFERGLLGMCMKWKKNVFCQAILCVLLLGRNKTRNILVVPDLCQRLCFKRGNNSNRPPPLFRTFPVPPERFWRGQDGRDSSREAGRGSAGKIREVDGLAMMPLKTRVLAMIATER